MINYYCSGYKEDTQIPKEKVVKGKDGGASKEDIALNPSVMTETQKSHPAESELSPCPKCHCMTKSIRKSRAKFLCGKCKYDKSLSDVFFEEAINRIEKPNITNKQENKK